MSNLPSDKEARKNLPVATGVVDYFPDALTEISRVSKIGNDQHNPGQPLHWDRSKSTDEADALMRHLIQRGTIDTDGARHSAKMAWRALALLQKEIESEKRKDLDDISPPEAGDRCDRVVYAPGSTIRYNSASESNKEVFDCNNAILNQINTIIESGYSYDLLYNETRDDTTVNILDLYDQCLYAYSFLVRGKVQRASDSERGVVQPGQLDCS